MDKIRIVNQKFVAGNLSIIVGYGLIVLFFSVCDLKSGARKEIR